MAVEAMGASISASCGWDGIYVGFRCLADRPGRDARPGRRHPAQSHLPRGGMAARARPDPRRPSGRSRTAPSRVPTGRFSHALYGPRHPYRFPLGGTEESVRSMTVATCRPSTRGCLVPGQAVGHRGRRRRRRNPGRCELDRPPRRLARPGRAPAADPDRRAAASAATPAARPPRCARRRSSGPATAASTGSHPPFDHMLLFNQVLGGQFTSRLNEKLREERGFTYGVRSQFECRRAAGPFSIGTSVQSDRLAEAIDDIRHEVRGVRDRPARRPRTSWTTPADRSSRASPATSRPPRPS